MCVAMETPSPSLIIIWGKMARGLLPRVTPAAPSLPSRFPPSLSFSARLRFLSPTFPIAVAASLLLLLLPPHLLLCVLLASLLPPPPWSARSSVCPPPRPRPARAPSPPPTASSTPSTSHPASPRRLIAPRHLLCPPREYYACTLPGRLCNHP